MSELKEHLFCECDKCIREYRGPLSNEMRPYYLKSEADKVIADLEMKLARAQLVLRLNEPKALYSDLEIMGRLRHEIDVVARRERHQKYKRCLAMAGRCRLRARLFGACGLYEKELWALKWHRRWLELAEVFK